MIPSALHRLWSKHRRYLEHPLFLAALGLKLLCGSFFAGHFLKDLFIPFVRYFTDSGFSDPWTHYLRLGVLDAFPYSSTMLAVLTPAQALGALLFGGSQNIPWNVELLLMRLPMLAADLAIYLILCRFFETRWRSVLNLYWCSPILFYINYIHGQIDAIPTAFLFISLYMALKSRPGWAGLWLAVGIAAKFHVAAAAPLIGWFLFKGSPSSEKKKAVLTFAAALAAVSAVLIGPALGSEGYRTLVLGAKEARWIYDVAWPFPLGMRVLLCPAAICALVLHFFSYERITRDLLLLYTGLMYTLLIVLVPPMPGWSYWCVPFLCFFLIRQGVTSYLPFWIYNAAYFLYTPLFSPVGMIPSQDYALPHLAHARDLSFTLMQTSLALVAIWIYRIGIKAYGHYRVERKPLAVGIGGDSGSGKHTLARAIVLLLGEENTVSLHGDDYHRWPRGDAAWDLKTHLHPRSNYVRQPTEHLHRLKNKQEIIKPVYDHSTGEFSPSVPVHPNRFILFAGLHPFVFPRMREAFDIRVFLDTDEALRQHWKLQRDAAKRGHSQEKILHEIERRRPDSESYIRPQAQFAHWTIQYLPADAADPKTTKGELPLRVRHSVSSSIVEMEDLLDELDRQSPKTLHAEWSMEPNLQRQILEAEGTLSAQAVRDIAYRLVPDLEDLLENKPVWLADLQGLDQLVFLVLLNAAVKR
ncbi:MAG: hypothetical protein WCU88_01350 [Elusimicrobiota bacterium]|jgi:uridine kinase